MKIKTIKTDVLSIGGSGAGIMSAIYAHESGLDVCLASKGKVGFSGNVIMAGGGFGIDGESGKDLGIEGCDVNFTKEKLFDAIVKESFFLSDQDLVEQYVNESPEVVNRMLKWGEESGQKYLFFPPANWITSGLAMSKSLLHGIGNYPDISIFEDLMITDILTNDGKVCGALGVEIYTGELVCFHCKSVIIGTGGFQPFSMKNTVSDMTGDGPAMALRAGAKVTDMEFLLAFPTAVIPKTMKGSIYPFIFEYNMRNLKFDIKDKDGNIVHIPENVIKMSRGGKLSKLVTSYYFGKAAEKGLLGPNGGLYYDYSQNSREEIEKGFNTLYERFGNWHRRGYYKGESLEEVEKIIYSGELLEVGMGFEYCMGGIEITNKMETSVPGLFAAGEVTSGVFGACRVGDGIVEMLCQGMRAGIEAGEYCKNNSLEMINKDKLNKHAKRYLSYFDNKEKYSSINHYKEIEKTCDEGFGLLRNESDMTKSLKRLETLSKKQRLISLNEKNREYNREWIAALQAENLLLCCRAAVQAGIERKESRGCHIRSDYQNVNHDEYCVKYVSELEGDELKMTVRKPRVTKISLPQGTKKSVVEYFLDPDLKYER